MFMLQNLYYCLVDSVYLTACKIFVNVVKNRLFYTSFSEKVVTFSGTTEEYIVTTYAK